MEKVGVSYAQSDFNMGLAILERINGLLNIVAEAKLTGDFKTWRDSLMVISDEMADSYNKDTEEIFLKHLKYLIMIRIRKINYQLTELIKNQFLRKYPY